MYELLYIVPTPFTEKDLPAVAKKIKKIIEENGGKIIKEKNLGNKKLAYPIKQVYRGFYILLNLELDSEKIEKLNKELKLTPEVLRHLITRPVKRTPKKRGRKKDVLLEEGEESKKEKEESKKQGKNKKIDLKNLGEKIDNLFNI
jgi:small subunit ribosomal protein S6